MFAMERNDVAFVDVQFELVVVTPSDEFVYIGLKGGYIVGAPDDSIDSKVIGKCKRVRREAS